MEPQAGCLTCRQKCDPRWTCRQCIGPLFGCTALVHSGPVESFPVSANRYICMQTPSDSKLPLQCLSSSCCLPLLSLRRSCLGLQEAMHVIMWPSGYRRQTYQFCVGCKHKTYTGSSRGLSAALEEFWTNLI